MANKLLISGGCLRPGGYELGEGKYYGRAALLLLDTDTGHFEEVLSKSTGGEHYPTEHPNLQYTAACLEEDSLWLPTDTEIFKYRLPEFDLLGVYSHPCFQNIHSVHIFGDDLVVTSTGLDQIIIMDKENGQIKQIVSALGDDPWYRFDPSKDYRKLHSTRPHAAHPNFIFRLDNSYWATRCKQEDGVNLDNFSQVIDITGNTGISVHDGLWWNEKLIFTRVDGMLVIYDPSSKNPVENVDLFEAQSNRPYGWCRGLYIDGNILYVGFSTLRKTKLKSKLKYLAKGNVKYFARNNALIAKYNIAERRVERVFETAAGSIDAIYGIVPFNY